MPTIQSLSGGLGNTLVKTMAKDRIEDEDTGHECCLRIYQEYGQVTEGREVTKRHIYDGGDLSEEALGNFAVASKRFRDVPLSRGMTGTAPAIYIR